MDHKAVRIANERLWAAHPELQGRQLTMRPVDAPFRTEWKEAYDEAVKASATRPAVVPAPAKPPPARPTVVADCPAAQTPIKTPDCKEIKTYVQEGDIVVRGGRGVRESEAIAKISKCNYSHAGIVARNDKGELVVVDAYPDRGPGDTNAVAAKSVDDFFCGHEATHGLVTRPKDREKAKRAAEWAMGETKDPSYTFNIWDPWTRDTKKLYCSDFVYQSYQNAGVDLVPTKMDFLSPANRKNTLDTAREFEGGLARVAPDSKIEKELLKRTGGSSEYITPCQVATNSNTDTAVTFDKPVSSGGSSEGTGKKR